MGTLKHKAIPSCIIPDVVNRTFGNRTQLLDWVRLVFGSVRGDKVISYYNTVEQLYQNSLKSHLRGQKIHRTTDH